MSTTITNRGRKLHFGCAIALQLVVCVISLVGWLRSYYRPEEFKIIRTEYVSNIEISEYFVVYYGCGGLAVLYQVSVANDPTPLPKVRASSVFRYQSLDLSYNMYPWTSGNSNLLTLMGFDYIDASTGDRSGFVYRTVTIPFYAVLFLQVILALWTLLCFRKSWQRRGFEALLIKSRFGINP